MGKNRGRGGYTNFWRAAGGGIYCDRRVADSGLGKGAIWTFYEIYKEERESEGATKKVAAKAAGGLQRLLVCWRRGFRVGMASLGPRGECRRRA